MSADQKTPQGAPKSDSSVRANRLRHCGELMQEVEKCHAQGLFHRMAGVCNFEASLLADCMHEEVRDDTSRDQSVLVHAS